MNLNVRKLIQAPRQLADGTQTAVIISTAALIVALIALFAASHSKGGSN